MQQADAWLFRAAAAPPPPLLDDGWGAHDGGGGGSLARTQDAAASVAAAPPRGYSADVGALLSKAAAEALAWQPAGAAANPGERIAEPSDDDARALTLAHALHGACAVPKHGAAHANAAADAGMPPAAAEARAQPPQTVAASVSAQPAWGPMAAHPPPGHAAAGGAGLEAEAEAALTLPRGINPARAWQAPQLSACLKFVDDDDFEHSEDGFAAAPPAAPPKPALAPAAPLRVRPPGPAAPESLIGRDVRVRYPRGMYDGRISDTRYLAKDGQVWCVLFTDGSDEELTWPKISKGLEAAEAAAAAAAAAAQRAPWPVPEAVRPAVAARVPAAQKPHKSARSRSSRAAAPPSGRAKQSPVPRALLELLPAADAGRGGAKPKLGASSMGLAERVKLRRGDGADAAPSPMRAARPGLASPSHADAGQAVADARRPLAGQRVRIRSLSGGHDEWLEGVVLQRFNGYHNVLFDDGTMRTRVPVDELRRGVLQPVLGARSPDSEAAGGELRSPGERGGGSAFSSPRSSPAQRKRARSPDAAAEPHKQARSGSDDTAEPHEAAPDEDLDDDSRRAEVEQVQAFLRSISPPLSQLDAAVAVVAASGITMAQLAVVHRVSDELRPLYVATATEGLHITHAADKLNFIAALDILAPQPVADVADEEQA